MQRDPIYDVKETMRRSPAPRLYIHTHTHTSPCWSVHVQSLEEHIFTGVVRSHLPKTMVTSEGPAQAGDQGGSLALPNPPRGSPRVAIGLKITKTV